MKRLIILFGLIVFAAALSTAVYAEDSVLKPVVVDEGVKCVFGNSSVEQKCYSSDGLSSCSGVGSCVMNVSGEKGAKSTWKSTCGGYATSTIDGQNESVVFECASAISEQVKCVFKGSMSEQRCYDTKNVSKCGPNTKCFSDNLNVRSCQGEKSCVVEVTGMKNDASTWVSTCGGSVNTVLDGQSKYAVFDCAAPASEKVKCVFDGSDIDQKCYALVDNKEVGCTGRDSCVLDIRGAKGEKIAWKSSCGGYTYTLLDGLGEYEGSGDYAKFSCASTTPSITVSPIDDDASWIVGSKQTITWLSNGIPASNYVDIRIRSTDASVDELLVKTQNDGSEEVVTPDVVSGAYIVELKTEVNGLPISASGDEKVHISAVDSSVLEKIKCHFKGAQEEQKCYAATDGYEFSCSGKESCIMEIKGNKNDKVTWKSSCGGYAYTIMDGKGNYDSIGEYAEFDCSPTAMTINDDANDIFNDRFDSILFDLKQLRDSLQEQTNKDKYLNMIIKDLKNISEKLTKSINDFITYGVDANTKKLGAGERSAVIASYKKAFNKLPETETEIADAIKIANGNFPSITSETAEKHAKMKFNKIYKRVPDLSDPNDNAAVKIMAYGLRQKASNRNINSEKSGINTFKSIFGKTPKDTEDWNAMQAITYSGATKKADSDNDGVADETEIKLNTDPTRSDSDGDGYKDGEEVLNGYDPLKK